jgi:3',5'-cyclic AMP phosphodiesterase CpdA
VVVNKKFLRSLIVALSSVLLSTAIFLSCADEGECTADRISYEEFAFAVISDTHVMTGDDVDNNNRFVEAGRLLREVQPAVDFVFNTGDCIEDLLCHPASGTCVDPLASITTYRNLIEQAYPMPFYFLLGNHDNRYLNSWLGNDEPIVSWKYVFDDTMMMPDAYYSFRHKNVLFVALFGSDLAFDHDSNDVASFGEVQLAWLESLLATGAPTVLLWHQYIDPITEMQLEQPNPIMAIIEAHADTIIGVFAGHGHRFMDREWQGVHFYQTGAVKGEGDIAYHHVKFAPETKTLEILNTDSIEYVVP